MKVLAILASPRKDGNTETLLNKVIKGVEHTGGIVEKISLTEYPVQPVQDCGICLSKGECTIKGEDHYDMIMEKFIKADSVLFATPTYWYSISAQLKAFIDRWSCSLERMPDFRSKIRGKKAAVITVYGEKDPSVTKHLFEMMKRSFQYIGIDFIGRVQARAYNRDEIQENKEALEKAYKLGLSIGARKYFTENSL